MRIPRIFHWIWLGPHSLPAEHAIWREDWLAKHPGWRAMVWTESNLPSLINSTEFAAARSFAQAADILRYEIVWQYGGIYLDTDMECLKNIEPLLDDMEAFAGWLERDEIGTGIFGATAAHPWLDEVVKRLPAAMRTGFGILHQTGPRFFTRVTQRRSEVALFPDHVLYGQAGNPETYCLHHAAGSWHQHQRHETDKKLRAIAELEIDPLVPPDETFARIDDDIGIERYSARRSVSFSAPDGEALGCPADDAAAIWRVQRLRSGGLRYLAVVGASSWWLEYYTGFDAYLRKNSDCLLQNERVILFSLH